MKLLADLPNNYRKDHPLFPVSAARKTRNGFFEIPFESNMLRVVCSDGEGWEHVSVSLKNRTPNWKEMCFIKDCFFNENETCLQYHPAKTDYVNLHPNCLHIWKPTGKKFPIPKSYLVGGWRDEDVKNMKKDGLL